ncbi:S41 family peptidase [Bacteroides sp. ET225]|uniref:S41 family peptidase n=1 Tax=Bacteroides sp. ET225 TaxID=2972461 RepID=UPI0021ACED2D|nr:S41 family peptidase [Bacteroides sp. ET225]MCR8918818.1 PDZ domain-containing protein [Bacteroides sp. ET225]
MKKQFLFSLLALSAATGAKADGNEARLLRFPATNGTDIVFSYAGDLYTAPIAGGEARRLTSHVGYEIFPRFSPDGKTIAFTGEYDGNREVYIIPADGGEPRRLTYTATNARDDVGDRMGPNNIVMTWTPNGEGVVYRNRISDGFDGRLWTAPLSDGMPQALPLPEGGFCSYAPDGKRMAYNRVFREFRNWKYYRGGMADDIWLYDPDAKKVENLTNNVAQDICPMWIGDDIYFISDRDRTMNLFVYHTATRQTEKITDYTDYDIKFPSTDGKQIVYEHAGYLYRFDPQTGKNEQIRITLNAENIYARTEQKHVADYVTAARLSADGKRLAVTARGEVFDVPATKGVTRNISRTPGANEREADWSPDGRYIAYISDRTGETEIYLQPAEGGEPVQLTTGNDTYIRSLSWSPDSKTVLYTDRKNRIVTVDVASKTKNIVMQNPEQEFYGVNFSPDSRWITYTKPAANDFSVVYVYNLATKQEYPVTEKWYNSSSPVFSTDGKYLIFESDRDFNPIYGRLEWNHVYTRMGGIYLALLTNDTPSPFLPADEAVNSDKEEEGGKVPAKDAKKKDIKTEDKAVEIAPEGIAGRIVKLPLSAGNYWNLYSDGQTVWYYGDNGTHAFSLKDQKDELIAENAVMAPMDGSKKVLYMRGNSLYVGELSTQKVTLDNKVCLDDMVAPIDYQQEWAQIFDEAWRAYRDGFYVENMHGVDWKAIKEKYAVLLPYVKTRLDLNYIIGAMIAELACGHAYVNPGEYPKPERIGMGLLGAELSRDEQTGFYRIDRILPGAPYSEKLRSPLTEPGMNIEEGDYITAIDGVPTTSVRNIYQLLIGKAGVLTELSVSSKAAADGARKVVVRPTDNEYPLYHYNWVQKNLRRVEEATDGRVGYIYIPDMGPEGLNEFARYFYPQLDKEALIIDDRANGGGNVSPMIIERLLRKPYRMTMSRTSTRTGTIPDATQYGPKILLINKYSASDGDLFPWSFKANKLGTVIGTRTWGGIVGISGSLPYMDGTDIRVPFFTNYDAKTGQWIVENHGVDPDILIDNDPIREQSGTDQQLEKAIEVALEQLKERKPLPSVPEPRTMKDLGVK